MYCIVLYCIVLYCLYVCMYVLDIVLYDDWVMIAGDKDDTSGILMIHSWTRGLFANQCAWNLRMCHLWLNPD